MWTLKRGTTWASSWKKKKQNKTKNLITPVHCSLLRMQSIPFCCSVYINHPISGRAGAWWAGFCRPNAHRRRCHCSQSDTSIGRRQDSDDTSLHHTTRMPTAPREGCWSLSSVGWPLHSRQEPPPILVFSSKFTLNTHFIQFTQLSLCKYSWLRVFSQLWL